jgi:hypothetical protein
MDGGSREKTQDMSQRKPCSLTRKPNKKQRVNDRAQQRHSGEAAAGGTGHNGLSDATHRTLQKSHDCEIGSLNGTPEPSWQTGASATLSLPQARTGLVAPPLERPSTTMTSKLFVGILAADKCVMMSAASLSATIATENRTAFGFAAGTLLAVDADRERSDRKPLVSGSWLKELTWWIFLWEVYNHFPVAVSAAVTRKPKRSIIIREEYGWNAPARLPKADSTPKSAPVRRFIAERFDFLNAVPISSTVC